MQANCCTLPLSDAYHQYFLSQAFIFSFLKFCVLSELLRYAFIRILHANKLVNIYFTIALILPFLKQHVHYANNSNSGHVCIQ